jgi:hypothetical protein
VSDFALDASGDLQVTAGRLSVVTGQSAVAQRLSIRLRLFRGDWFLNALEGVPYHDQVLPKGASAAVRREVIRRVIATMAGVQRVVSLDLQLDAAARSLQVRGEIELQDLSTLPFALTPPLFDFGDPIVEGAAT